MPTIDEVQGWNGRHLIGADDHKIGTIDGIYIDDRTGLPTWALVHTGLLGRKSSFVQITDAQVRGKDVHVPFDKAMVKDAPGIEPDGHLEPEEEAELYRYYGRADDDRPMAVGDASAEPDTTPTPVTAPTTDDAMVLSEERVQVSTRELPATKVRMRKYTVTEEVTVTVPVTREEVRLEEVPVDAPDLDPAEAPSVDASGAVILHSEVPVIQTKSVQTERVRLGKETVTEDVQVTEPVRREQVELDHTPTDETR